MTLCPKCKINLEKVHNKKFEDAQRMGIDYLWGEVKRDLEEGETECNVCGANQKELFLNKL